MSQPRLAIIGISGRMGDALCELAPKFGFNLTSGVATSKALVAGVQSVAKVSELDAAKIDIVIDFSLPELTVEIAGWCVQNSKPLVSGVTGLQPHHREAIENAARKIPVLWAPNMSLGVAVMGRMLQQFQHLQDFDFQVEEFHHTKKKDKPSGTAVRLQEQLAAAVKKPLPDPLSIRGGGIFGIHRIFAMGEEEMITIEHTAMNRRVFARGALSAAQWISHRTSGLYRIDDVLGT